MGGVPSKKKKKGPCAAADEPVRPAALKRREAHTNTHVGKNENREGREE